MEEPIPPLASRNLYRHPCRTDRFSGILAPDVALPQRPASLSSLGRPYAKPLIVKAGRCANIFNGGTQTSADIQILSALMDGVALAQERQFESPSYPLAAPIQLRTSGSVARPFQSLPDAKPLRTRVADPSASGHIAADHPPQPSCFPTLAPANSQRGWSLVLESHHLLS